MALVRHARSLLRFCFCAALVITTGGLREAAAQAADDSILLRPQADGGRMPLRFEPQRYGNPPGFGAGTTGFDSLNRRKRNSRTAPRAPAPIAQAPIVVRGSDPTLAPVFRQQGRPVLRSPYPQAGVLPGGAVGAFQRPVRRGVEDDPYEPVGLRLGTFIVKPAVEISTGYDSNVPRQQNGQSSAVTKVAPELIAKSDWARHEVSANLRGDYSWYNALPTYNRPSFDGKIAGRLDITRQTRADLEGRFQYGADNPGNPNLPTDVSKPVVNTNLGASAGLTQGFNRFEVSLRGNVDEKSYDDATLNDGTIVSQRERNYTQYSSQLRGSYEIYPGVKPFVEGGIDRRVHEMKVDSSGFQRDSDGQTLKVGSTFELSRRLTGEASVGITKRSYKEPAFPELTAFIADASLIWYATPLNTVTLTAKSSVDESVIPGVSGVLHREAGVQVDHSFRRWLIGSLKFVYGQDAYEGGFREDRTYSASASLVYKLSRTAQIKGEFRQERLRSNVPGQDYTANVVMVGLRLQR